jgi:hypothetical protein
MRRNLVRTLPGFLLVLTAALSLGVAPAQAVNVKLRIEGASYTIFEGQINTSVHTIGGHKCDGTNGGASSTSGPTATGALDDGQSQGNYTWAGSWFDSFEDFLVDRVGFDSANSSQFWGFAVNYSAAQVGGCQYKLGGGEEVLWAYDFFNKSHFLYLTGPSQAEVNKPFKVRVTDGPNGGAIEGADVAGQHTDSNGEAALQFDQTGAKKVKAERSDSVRSNLLTVNIVPATGSTGSSGEFSSGSPTATTPTTTPTSTAPTGTTYPTATTTSPTGTTTSTGTSGGSFGGGTTTGSGTSRGSFQASDYDPPVVRIVGIKDHGTYGEGPRRIQGLVKDESGLDQVYVRLIRVHDGECSWFSAARRRFNPTCARPRFVPVGDRSLWQLVFRDRLGPGRYVLQVRARDKAGNAYPSTDDGRSRIHFEVG